MDGTVLIDETRHRVSARFDIWRETLKSKGFRFIRTKIEYLDCKVSVALDEANVEVRLATQTISKREVKLSGIHNCG